MSGMWNVEQNTFYCMNTMNVTNFCARGRTKVFSTLFQLYQSECQVLKCRRTLTTAEMRGSPRSSQIAGNKVSNKMLHPKTSTSTLAGNPSLYSSASGTITNGANKRSDSKDEIGKLTGISSTETNSVSSEEVSKFSSMAKTWWQVDHNPLISMNPVRMSFITDQISKHLSISHDYVESSLSKLNEGTNKQHPKPYLPLKGLKALDVGCGGGLLSESLARLGANVTAIDPSREVARAAQIHSQKSKDGRVRDITYMGGVSVEDLAQQYSITNDNDNLFDIVCVLEVIEHATDPRSLMMAATSLLKKPSSTPGGMLFVSTINRTVKSYGIAIVGGEYITGKLPIGTHSWDQFLSPQEVNKLVSEFDISEVEKKGMILQPPFYNLRWLLQDDDYDVNWIGSYSY